MKVSPVEQDTIDCEYSKNQNQKNNFIKEIHIMQFLVQTLQYFSKNLELFFCVAENMKKLP